MLKKCGNFPARQVAGETWLMESPIALLTGTKT